MHYFLGVDVGSTKTHALISDEDGQALGFGKAGAGNHEVVDYPGLEAALQASTRAALEMASIPKEQIAGAGFGVSGYDWPSERQPTLEVIASLGLSCPLDAVNDTVLGLLAGASQGWGIAVVSGTGNNCWGWDAQRRTGRVTGMCGGFGEFCGSGELVWKAFHNVVHAWTRRGPPTHLTQAFIERVGASDATDLLEGVSQGRYQLDAGAAPLVFQVARAGDAVAQEVITWAGQELGMLVISVVRQLGFQKLDFEVVLIGSMFEGGTLLTDPMRQTIHTEAPGARLVRLAAPPVVGGVVLGMQVAGIDAPARRERLIQSTAAMLKAVGKGA
jgi:N-acetylglucosamine kinase-like BadF-type ATPase